MGGEGHSAKQKRGVEMGGDGQGLGDGRGLGEEGGEHTAMERRERMKCREL